VVRANLLKGGGGKVQEIMVAHHKVNMHALKPRGSHGVQGISGVAVEHSGRPKMTGHLIGIAGKLTVAIAYRSAENTIAMMTCETT